MSPCIDGGDSAGEASDLCRGRLTAGGAITNLAESVVAPALHGSCVRQGTRMEGACCDGGDSAGESGDLCGCEAIGAGVVAKLAVIVVAPAFQGSGVQ